MFKEGGGDREGNHVLVAYEKSLGNLSSAFFEIKSQYKGIKSNYIPDYGVSQATLKPSFFSL